MSAARSLRAGVALVALGSAVAACGGDGGSEPAPAAASLRVTPAAPSLRMGETVRLQAAAVDPSGAAAALPPGAAVGWASDDTTIAVVSATGEARAVRPGTVTLRATSGPASGQAALTVRAPVAQPAAAARASARIGPEGGTVVATSGGRRYALVVPPGALRDSTDVELTPLAGFADLPDGGTLLAGAHFAPAGLRFLRPATLRVEGVATSGLDPRRLTGAAYEGTGADLRRTLLGVRGDTLLFLVPHFSGSAALDIPIAREIPLPARPGLEDPFVDRLARHFEEWRFDASWPIADSAAVTLRDWYVQRVRPALDGAASDTAMITALGAFATWYETIACGGESPCATVLLEAATPRHFWPDAAGSAIRAAVAADLGDGLARLTAALRRVAEADVAECRTTADTQVALRRIANAHHWQWWLGLQGSPLDPEPVGRCVRVVFGAVTFPETIDGGTPAPLEVTGGLSFAGRPWSPEFAISVTVSASGATPAAAEGVTAGDGRWSTTLTPNGAEPVFLGIRARHLSFGLESALFRDTVVERQLGVTIALTPTAAILDPGATATFAATVGGTTNPAVTWSATGGTITSAGVYAAGSTPGTYAVTARSVADPTKTATATVTIAGGPTGRGRVVLDELGASAQARNFLSGKGETCLVGDAVEQGSTFPSARVLGAPCATSAVSDSGVAMSASATGSGRYELTLAGGALARLATTGAAAATVAGGPPDAGGSARAHMTLVVHFEVVDGPVDLVMRGGLDVDIPDAASNAAGGGTFSLYAKDLGRSLHLVRSGRGSSRDPVLPPASLDATVRLAPGRYFFALDAHADANVADLVSVRASGGYGLSIDVVPVP